MERELRPTGLPGTGTGAPRDPARHGLHPPDPGRRLRGPGLRLLLEHDAGGFVEPNLQDTLVIDIRAPEAIAGLYNHPFRVYNHTDRDIFLQRVSSNGPEGGEPYRFRAIIERLTPEGEWEHHSTDFNPWDGVHPLLLRSGECIQAWNPVAINSLGGPGPPGTYRMKLEYSFESHAGLSVYSDPVVVPEG